MHASVCRYESATGSSGEVMRIGRLLTRALAEESGFISYALLDAGAGSLVSVSIFETEAQLRLAEIFLITWLAEHLPTSSAQATLVASGEIIVQRGM